MADGFRLSVSGNVGRHKGRFVSLKDPLAAKTQDILEAQAVRLMDALREATPVNQPLPFESYRHRQVKEGYYLSDMDAGAGYGQIQILNKARGRHVRTSLFNIVDHGTSPHFIKADHAKNLVFPDRHGHRRAEEGYHHDQVSIDKVRAGIARTFTGKQTPAKLKRRAKLQRRDRQKFMRYEPFVFHPGARPARITQRAMADVGGVEAIERALRVGARSAVVAAIEAQFVGDGAYAADDVEAMTGALRSDRARARAE